MSMLISAVLAHGGLFLGYSVDLIERKKQNNEHQRFLLSMFIKIGAWGISNTLGFRSKIRRRSV